jgi:hypothetical protein
LSALEELIRRGEVSLIVPTVVLVEFARHKARIVAESRRSLLMLEYEGWDQRPRSLSEVLDAIDDLVTKVWHNRHLVLWEKVMLGQVKIVDRAEAARQKFSDKVIARDVWEGALRSAKKVEQRFGRENLGPYSDFDWGMMNGKLSAPRWLLGEEWDELYT